MMKTKLSIRNISGNLLLVLTVCLFFTACTDDTLTSDKPLLPGSGPGEVPVRITIRTAVPTGHYNTRSQTAGETKISDVNVIVYHNDIYAYKVQGTGISSTSTSTTFGVVLQSYTGKVKLCFFANAEEFFPQESEWATIAEGNTETDINKWLVNEIPIEGVTGSLPMYGEFILTQGLIQGNKNEINNVNMLRALARVDIILNEEISNFVLETVQVFRVPDKIAIVPDEPVDYSEPVVTQPTTPGTSTVNLDEISIINNRLMASLYLPEASSVSKEGYVQKAVCLVVGGRFSDQAETDARHYYRIDFRSGEAIGQILRNHRYVFRVEHVEPSNQRNAAEASVNGSQNITTILEEWDDGQTNEITDGTNMFGFSARSLTLRFREGSAGFIDFRTNLESNNYGWVDEKGVPISASSSDAEVRNDNFAAIIDNVEEGSNNEKYFSIRISSLNRNNSSDRITGYLRVNAGNRWNITIQVSQLSRSDNNNVIINILSMATTTTQYGNLGGSYPGGHGGASSAIRPILLNYDNFGPEGTVPLKFIGMDNVPINTSETDLRKALQMYDMMHVMTGSNPSASQAQAIVDWLNASPNRVLFVSRDRDNNNTELLNKLDAMTGGTWTGGGTSSSSGREFKSSDSHQADYFLRSGPFGGLNINNFNSYNTYWRSIAPGTALYQRVVPLLESTNDGMGCVLGIDIANRVVYVGHPHIYQNYTAAGMGTNGQVEGSGLARMFANIYAWAIEELIIPGKLK